MSGQKNLLGKQDGFQKILSGILSEYMEIINIFRGIKFTNKGIKFLKTPSESIGQIYYLRTRAFEDWGSYDLC